MKRKKLNINLSKIASKVENAIIGELGITGFILCLVIPDKDFMNVSNYVTNLQNDSDILCVLENIKKQIIHESGECN